MNAKKIIHNTPKDLTKPMDWKNNQFDQFDDLMIVIHHTVGGTMKTIDQSHRNRMTLKYGQPLGYVNGEIAQYPNIAYHYIITSGGMVYQNRGIDQVGYHAANAYTNNRAIAISFGGNFEIEKLDNVRLKALASILKDIDAKYSQGGKKPFKIFGHFQVGDVYTACPGKNIIKYLNKFNKLANSKQWENFNLEYLENMEDPYESINLLNGGKKSMTTNNQTISPTQSEKGFYESIFFNEFNGKSSVISDIPQAIKRLTNTPKERENFFFFLIALERLQKTKSN